jgi:hypothetical protein
VAAITHEQTPQTLEKRPRKKWSKLSVLILVAAGTLRSGRIVYTQFKH